MLEGRSEKKHAASEKLARHSTALPVIEQAEIEIKYGGYLNKEKESVKKLKRLENITIVEDSNYPYVSNQNSDNIIIVFQ